MEQKWSETGTKVPQKGDKYRAYCITWNNYTDESIDVCRRTLQKCAYGIFGLEVGESGTPHIQGYFRFKNPISWEGFRKTFLGAHISIAKGDDISNKVYCSKDGKCEEKGTPIAKKQGKRTDLTEVKEQILTGEITTDDIAIENPMMYHQYGRTLQKIEDIAMRKKRRTEMTKGVWLWGETGVGKSHFANALSECKTNYWLPKDGGWWDGYKQEEVVIINEFRGTIQYGELLEMIDKWPYQVRRRGREPLPFTSKYVIITSSMPPEKIFYNLNELDKLDQINRRMTIIEVTKPDLNLTLEQMFGTEVVRGVIVEPSDQIMPAAQIAPAAQESPPSAESPGNVSLRETPPSADPPSVPKRGRGRPRKVRS